MLMSCFAKRGKDYQTRERRQLENKNTFPDFLNATQQRTQHFFYSSLLHKQTWTSELFVGHVWTPQPSITHLLDSRPEGLDSSAHIWAVWQLIGNFAFWFPVKYWAQEDKRHLFFTEPCPPSKLQCRAENCLRCGGRGPKHLGPSSPLPPKFK